MGVYTVSSGKGIGRRKCWLAISETLALPHWCAGLSMIRKEQGLPTPILSKGKVSLQSGLGKTGVTWWQSQDCLGSWSQVFSPCKSRLAFSYFKSLMMVEVYVARSKDTGHTGVLSGSPALVLWYCCSVRILSWIVFLWESRTVPFPKYLSILGDRWDWLCSSVWKRNIR